MQKNSITNKITPCCNLPFSVTYWWVSNLTLNSESDREFILSKISQSGTISIDAWKILINSGTLESDSSLTKVEFLAWFDCKNQPSCEQIKIIIESYKISNWDYWAESLEELNENFDNLKEELSLKYNDTISTKAIDIIERVDKFTGELTTYKEVDIWKDGSVMDDSKVDDVIYIKIGDVFYKREYTGNADVKWWGVVADGIVDDTLKLQKAIDTVNYLYFGDEKSTFKISNQLNINNGSKLKSNGAKIIQTISDKPIFNCLNKDDFNVMGFNLQGEGVIYIPSSSSLCVGIYCLGSKNFVIEGNYFSKFTYSGISGVVGVEDCIIQNNTIDGGFDIAWAAPDVTYPTGKKDNTGITIGGNKIIIKNNSFKNTSQGIIIAENSNAISINNNIILNTILEHGVYVDTGCNNVNLTENKIFDVLKNCIKVQNYDVVGYKCENISITGNILDGAGSGGDGIQVLSTGGFSMKAKNVIISENIISNTQQHCINVRYSNEVNIFGNVLKNGLVGIYISNLNNCIVSTNNISICKNNAIYDNGTSDNINYINNVITKCSQAADASAENNSSMFIQGDGKRILQGNNIISDNVKTHYGILIQAIDLNGLTLINNKITGSSLPAIRLVSVTNNFNNFFGNQLFGITEDDFKDFVQGMPNGIFKSGNDYVSDSIPASVLNYQEGTKVYKLIPSDVIGWVLNSGVWLPFGAVGMIKASASIDTATAVSATYSQTEVQAILDELRDLKNKMRIAKIINT